MKPASYNQLMSCVFGILVIVVSCTNKVCLTVQAKEVTIMALLNGAELPLIFMLVYGFMWVAEDRAK